MPGFREGFLARLQDLSTRGRVRDTMDLLQEVGDEMFDAVQTRANRVEELFMDRMDTLDAQLASLSQQITMMNQDLNANFTTLTETLMSDFTQLNDAETAEESVEAKLIAKLDEYAAQVASNLTNPVALQAVVSKIQADTAAMSAALDKATKETTPVTAAPVTTAPVAAAPVAPIPAPTAPTAPAPSGAPTISGAGNVSSSGGASTVTGASTVMGAGSIGGSAMDTPKP